MLITIPVKIYLKCCLAKKSTLSLHNCFQKLTKHRDFPLCTVAVLYLARLLLHNKLGGEAPRNPAIQLRYLRSYFVNFIINITCEILNKLYSPHRETHHSSTTESIFRDSEQKFARYQLRKRL